MQNKILFSIVLVISAFSLFISMGLFYNMAIFVDEHNLTPADVCGSELWLILDWIKMGLLFILILVAVSGLFAAKNSNDN